jgi:type I restriction enzyme S subunit
LYYFLVNLQLNQFAEGSSHPLVTQTLLNSIEIEISDDVNEQKAIASVLTSLEDKIDLLHRKNITLEAMAVVLFRQWFVEKEDESWESIKIKNFDAFVTDYVANGSFASLAANVKYKDEPDYAILIRLTDFNNNFKNGFVYVDEHAYNFLEKSKLICGEVIISNVGAYSGTVFRCPQLDKPMTLGPNSIVIKSKHNHFFYLYFKSIKGKYFLDGIISGSAQPKFNKTAFKDLEISYPNLDYLKDFESIVQPFFSKIDSNSLQIRTLENLRDTLLPKLISGEVRVTL